MTTLKRWCAVVSLVIVWGVTVAAQQPTQQGEFIPVSELPPQEQLPAAPLLIGAYAFVLLVLFVYVFFVARRLTAVQQELERLDSSVKQGGRA
jgi:CcmD family protein